MTLKGYSRATQVWLAVLAVLGAACSNNDNNGGSVTYALAYIPSFLPLLNPVIVGIVAGIGQTLGEMTGYMAGYSGQGLVNRSKTYDRVEGWMKRNEFMGELVVFVLALIPNPFFDAAGMAAGALRFPVWKYLLAAGAGKVIKITVGGKTDESRTKLVTLGLIPAARGERRKTKAEEVHLSMEVVPDRRTARSSRTASPAL